MTDKSSPPVAVVCATYRNPEHDTTGRMMGLMGTITQFLDQDYKGQVSLAVVDSSPTPHPFAAIAADTHPDRFIYMHVPDRKAVNDVYKKKYPNAMQCIPNDADLATAQWKLQAKRVEGWARFVPIEDDFPRWVDIGQQMFESRPTIGMKKNTGVMAIAETFGEPQHIVFSDDDDYHGPTYVQDLVNGIGNAGFTRINRHLVGINNPKISTKPMWGMYDFDFPQDANGNHYVSDQMKAEPILTSEVLPDGGIREVNPREWFKRAMVLAWSPCSHEGALHSYDYKTWKKGFDAFGGSPACSFGEDVILYKMMKDHFGREFQGTLTDVPADPMEMNFLRTADGTNATYLMYNRKLTDEAPIPDWARKSMADFSAVRTSGQDPALVAAKLGKQYAQTGIYAPQGLMLPHTQAGNPFKQTGPGF